MWSHNAELTQIYDYVDIHPSHVFQNLQHWTALYIFIYSHLLNSSFCICLYSIEWYIQKKKFSYLGCRLSNWWKSFKKSCYLIQNMNTKVFENFTYHQRLCDSNPEILYKKLNFEDYAMINKVILNYVEWSFLLLIFFFFIRAIKDTQSIKHLYFHFIFLNEMRSSKQ